MSDQTDLHPSRKRLALFAHGRLPDAELTAVADHVSACDECCQTLQHPAADTLANLAHTREPAQPARAIRPDIPEDIAGVVRKMMAKNPADRHATAAEVAADLAPLMKNTEPTVPLPELPPPPVTAARDGDTAPMPRARIEWEAKRRRSVPLPLLAAGAGVISLLLVTAIYFAVRPPRVATSGRDTKSATANTGRDLGTTAATKGRRALFILPPAGLWNDDYQPARARLEQLGCTVTTAAPARVSRQAPGQTSPGPDVTVDLLFNDQLSAADFDAVVFVGFQVKPFVDEYQAVTRRVIDAFQTAGKPVAAICGGQQVLARLGYLDNHSAAYSAVGSPGNLARPINWQRNQRVVTDGPLVTAGSGADAVPFADAVAKAMAGK